MERVEMKKKSKQRKITPVQRPKITFFCLVYNCEKYVAATIRSILNQTEKNIQLVIRNNGSTDKTGEICKKFADKDNRIIYIENKVNMMTDEGVFWYERAFWPSFNGEYISSIDGDDLLDPQFAAIMYQEAKKSQADIVVCGTTMFDDITGKAVGQRVPPEIVIKQMDKLEPFFVDIYGQFRPVWAKIFQKDFFETHYEYGRRFSKELKNGGDTFLSLSYLENCRCLVSKNQALHYYRIRSESAFHVQKIDPVRIQAGQLLYERGINCINTLDIANQRNQEFLVAVFFGHMEDLLRLLDRSSEMVIQEKLDFMIAITQNSLMKKFCEGERLFWHLFNRLSKSIDVLPGHEDFVFFQLTDNFLGKLYLAWQSREEKSHDLLFTVVLSALCDPLNSEQFGLFLLNEKWELTNNQLKKLVGLPMKQQNKLFGNPAALCDSLNQTENILELNSKKQNLLELIDERNYSAALFLLDEILEVCPLDREAWYFQIYVSYQLNKFKQAALYAQMAQAFWPEDEDMQEISCMVLQKMENITGGYDDE